MARSSAVTAAAVGRSTPNAISPATRPPSTGPRPASPGRCRRAWRGSRAWRSCRREHDAERERRARQPEEVLQPQQRRVADARREETALTRCRARRVRHPLSDAPARGERQSAKPAMARTATRPSARPAGRHPGRERPDRDQRHSSQHQHRRQFRQPIPDGGGGRLRPRCAAAQADQPDAAHFTARGRREVAGRDSSERRERGARDGHLAAERAQEAAPSRAGDEEADDVQQKGRDRVGRPGGRQSFDAGCDGVPDGVQSTIIDVGAPLRNWIFRVAMSLAVVTVVAAVVVAPAPLWLRIVLLAALIAAGSIRRSGVCRHSNPLGRIRWHLPVSNGGATLRHHVRRWAEPGDGGGARHPRDRGRAGDVFRPRRQRRAASGDRAARPRRGARRRDPRDEPRQAGGRCADAIEQQVYGRDAACSSGSA